MIEGTGALHTATHSFGGEPIAVEYCLCRHDVNHWLTDVWLPGDHPNTGGACSGPLRHYGAAAARLPPRLRRDGDPL